MHLAPLLDHALKVSPVCILHDNAKRLGIGKEEGGLVGDDVRHVD